MVEQLKGRNSKHLEAQSADLPELALHSAPELRWGIRT